MDGTWGRTGVKGSKYPLHLQSDKFHMVAGSWPGPHAAKSSAEALVEHK